MLVDCSIKRDLLLFLSRKRKARVRVSLIERLHHRAPLLSINSLFSLRRFSKRLGGFRCDCSACVQVVIEQIVLGFTLNSGISALLDERWRQRLLQLDCVSSSEWLVGFTEVQGTFPC